MPRSSIRDFCRLVDAYKAVLEESGPGSPEAIRVREEHLGDNEFQEVADALDRMYRNSPPAKPRKKGHGTA